MIGIVLVSHSKALALGIRELVMQMVGPEFPLAIAAGVGDDFDEVGTDAVHVAEVLKPFCEGDGAVVLMDLGSAVLSAQTALDLLEAEEIPDWQTKIRLCSAPIVEAAVAASVAANSGGDLDAVLREAMSALLPKESQVGDADPVVAVPATAAATGDALGFETEIHNPHGLHARPAATLVQAASKFAADVQLTNLTGGRGPASARSLTSVALLQVRKGDRVRFEVRGADADAALKALQALADDRFGEAEGPGAEPVAAVAMPAPGKTGVPASEGVAVGRAERLDAAIPEEPDAPVENAAKERARLDAAVRQVADDLKETAVHDATGIFAAQALVLSDPALLEGVHAKIAAGAAARAAWRTETTRLAEAYAAMEDPYLQARAADLKDIAMRVGRAMSGTGAALKIAPEPPAILLVDELLPSEATACDPDKVLGILARTGSASAHAAIIARTLGIPMVVGAARLDFAGLPGKLIAMDGGTGEIEVEPNAEVAAEFRARQEKRAAERAAFDAAKDRPAITSDGAAIEVMANVGNPLDAKSAAENGAEGVGLLRTEFAYLPFTETPSEDDQVRILGAVLANTPKGPVVVRTLDVGADKPLAFLDQPKEANPFLGVRGVRLSFRNPEFFAASLRAILRAGEGREIWVMFPMITSPEEMIRARGFVEAAHADLEKARVPHVWPVQIGMMVEVPAAALTLEQFVDHADFFSIGTNDLTQYVLAAERGNAGVAEMQDALHPAVLRAVRMICEKAGGRHVTVCGDAASDPVAASALIGAGVRSLSVRPNQVGAVKAKARQVSAAALEAKLAKLVDGATANDVRAGLADGG
jgi:multiphosphoryl transfer protein